MKRNFTHIWVATVIVLCALLVLPSCKTGSSTSSEGFTTINGDFPVVYAQRNLDAIGDPTDGVTFSAGGDLIYKDASIPVILPMNITAAYTQGQGDVSDPSVNFDATKVVFSMRGPNDETFSLWEMDVATKQYAPLITDNVVAEFGDDVDPAYLPDGRIVFTSNRQKRMQEMMTDQNIAKHKTLDEYEREPALQLHVLDPATQDITQISFNQSHDRNPTVLKDGRIMFSRWDHLANRNHFPIFTVNPDGTDLFVLYGAFSPGNSFLHPMEQRNGRIMSTLMPLSGTDEGGTIVSIDTANYSEHCEPAPGVPAGCNGQIDMYFNNQVVTFDGSFSPGGRYSTPMPLWDGTNRAVVSYAIAPNAQFGGIPTETHPFNGSVKQVFGPTKYQIWMLDFDSQVARVVQTDSPGKALVDPVPLFPRALSDYPLIIPEKPVDPIMAAEPNGLGNGQGMGVIGVKSVYHTDFLDIMGDRVLVPALGENIPKNGGVPDLLAMKDPNNASYLNRPGYFARVTRALPTPPGISRSAIGRTNFEMQEVLGYVPVEPDGSILAKVPADSALTISVLDKDGRAFQTHTNWLQVRPGETRTCSGCHSPRRAESALNVSPIAGSHANALGAETMAETRARLNNQGAPSLSPISADFTEYWSSGLEQNFKLALDNLDTPIPVNGRIDYVTHIQPIWEKDRGANTCVSCHKNSLLSDPISAGLTLEGGLSGFAGHIISYDQLMRGPFRVDENGIPLPPIVRESGRVVFPRGPALVRVGSSANSSRTSHLVETIFNTKLRAGGSYDIGVTDHASMLTADEKWLISTWVDIGAQYTNEPYELVNGQYVVRDAIVSSRTVSRTVFNDQIHPILKAECMSCHAPEGFSGDSSVDPAQFADENDEADEFNRFVLTGNQAGDFNVTRAMINNLCDPMNNDLLLRPISDNVAPNLPHPQILVDINDPLSATRPVFLDTGPGSSYDTILTWLMMGEASNPTCLN
ncbi:MAG: hypothetical protein HKN83_12285 [Gammaproteobacteria bacterium]|nr:hypothetical protein [Gammaproteobacteria bacterium]